MISNIHTTYLKGEKAFNGKKFTEAKKHLVSVVEHDKNHYAAYLLLFEILNKSQSSFLKVVVKELVLEVEGDVVEVVELPENEHHINSCRGFNCLRCV